MNWNKRSMYHPRYLGEFVYPKDPQGPSNGGVNEPVSRRGLGSQNRHFWGVRILRVGGGNSNNFLFSPRKLGKMNPFWLAHIFQMGGEKPTNSKRFFLCSFIRDFSWDWFFFTHSFATYCNAICFFHKHALVCFTPCFAMIFFFGGYATILE